MKFIKIYFLFAVSMFVSALKSEIPIVALKGMTSSPKDPDVGVKQEYVRFSPAMGALIWKSPFLQNVYIYGIENEPLKQLVMQLFHVHVDRSFDTTRSYTSIAKYFDAETTAKLVRLIATMGSEPKDDEAWNTFAERIVNDILRPLVERKFSEIKQGLNDGFEETMNRHKRDVAEIQKSLEMDNHYQKLLVELQSKTNRFNAAIQLLKDKAATMAPKERDALLAFVGTIENMYKKWMGFPEPSKLADFDKSIKTFIAMNQRLIRGDGKDVMDSFLELVNTIRAISNLPNIIDIKKGQERLVKIPGLINREANLQQNEKKNQTAIVNEDFNKSIPTIAQFIKDSLKQEVSGAYPHGTIINILLGFLWKKCDKIDELRLYLNTLASVLSISPQQLYTWPMQMTEYNQDDYLKLRELKDSAVIAQLSLDDWIFARYGFELYDNIVPPKVGMINRAKYKLYVFPDCGETSLRNFLNVLVYDNQKAIFNLKVLKALGAIESVMKYYTKYQGTAYIMTDLAHDDWVNVVAELPGVKYNSFDAYNFSGGISNMMRIINNLFPAIQSLEELKEKLKELGIEITFDSDKPIEQNDKHNELYITIKKPKTEEFELTWVFNGDHFEIYFPDTPPLDSAPQYRDALMMGEMTIAKAFLIAAFDATYNDLKNISLISKFGDFYLYLLPLYNDAQKIAAAAEVLQKAPAPHDPDFIKELYLQLTSQGPSLHEFVENILASREEKIKQTIIKIPKSSAGIFNAVKLILNKGLAKEYGQLISPYAIQQIAGDDAVELIEILRQKEIGVGADKPFMEKLFSWNITSKILQEAAANNLAALLNNLIAMPDPKEQKKHEFLEKIYEAAAAPEIVAKLSADKLYDILKTILESPEVNEFQQPKKGELIATTIRHEQLKKLSGYWLNKLLSRILELPEVNESVEPKKAALVANLSDPELLQKLSEDDYDCLSIILSPAVNETVESKKATLIGKLSNPEILNKISAKKLNNILLLILKSPEVKESEQPQKAGLIANLIALKQIENMDHQELSNLLVQILASSEVNELVEPKKGSLIRKLIIPEKLKKLEGSDLPWLFEVILRQQEIKESVQPQKTALVISLMSTEQLKKLPSEYDWIFIGVISTILAQPEINESEEPKKALLMKALIKPEQLSEISADLLGQILDRVLALPEANKSTEPKKAALIEWLSTPEQLLKLGAFEIGELLNKKHPRNSTLVRLLIAPEQLQKLEGLDDIIWQARDINEAEEPLRAQVIKAVLAEKEKRERAQ